MALGRRLADIAARSGSAARWLLYGVLWLACAQTVAQVPVESPAAAPTSLEQRVKAASLFRFLNYVDWPPSSFASKDFYRVGVIGAEEIAEELGRLVAGRTMNARAVTVTRLQASDPIGDVDVLYIGLPEGNPLDSIIRRAQGHPILIVTNAENALAHGSMINFRVAEDRVRFEISLDAVEQAGLHISSRMLAVALQVTRTQTR